MKTIDFNVNDYVYVKLTDIGREELRRRHYKPYKGFRTNQPEYTPSHEDKDGWSKWQMHELMNAFGHFMVNGFNVPFETTIRMETK